MKFSTMLLSGMGISVTVDDLLLARASEVTGIAEVDAVVQEALRALIARQAARDLIALGGSDPNAWAPNEGDESPA